MVKGFGRMLCHLGPTLKGHQRFKGSLADQESIPTKMWQCQTNSIHEKMSRETTFHNYDSYNN